MFVRARPGRATADITARHSPHFTIGNYITEVIYPSILHQDPRYFRKSSGTNWSRLAYAARQIFWTHTDSDKTQFNYSEILGNSSAVAISSAYYVDNRTAHQAISKLSVQLGVDTAGNILKEFGPDFEREFRRKHHHDQCELAIPPF